MRAPSRANFATHHLRLLGKRLNGNRAHSSLHNEGGPSLLPGPQAARDLPEHRRALPAPRPRLHRRRPGGGRPPGHDTGRPDPGHGRRRGREGGALVEARRRGNKRRDADRQGRLQARVRDKEQGPGPPDRHGGPARLLHVSGGPLHGVRGLRRDRRGGAHHGRARGGHIRGQGRGVRRRARPPRPQADEAQEAHREPGRAPGARPPPPPHGRVHRLRQARQDNSRDSQQGMPLRLHILLHELLLGPQVQDKEREARGGRDREGHPEVRDQHSRVRGRRAHPIAQVGLRIPGRAG